MYGRQLYPEQVLGEAPPQRGETLWENAGVRLWQRTDQDARIGEFFLTDGTDYTLTRRNPEPAPRDPARSIVELQRLQGRLGEMFLDATAADSEHGPAISPKEAAELRARLDDLFAHAQRLRAAFG